MALTLAEQFKNAVAPLQNKSDTLSYRLAAVDAIPAFESVWRAAGEDTNEKTGLARIFLRTLLEEARTLTQHQTVTGQGRAETFCMMMLDHMDRANIAASLPENELMTALKTLQGYGSHFYGYAGRTKSAFESTRYRSANNLCQDAADRIAVLSNRSKPR